MKRIIILCLFILSSAYSYALTENEASTFIKRYYQLLTEYAAAENINLARTIEGMHVGNGFVYPDVEINLGRGMTETKGVGIKSVYLASIMSRQNLLLKFVPRDISFESNINGISTFSYTLSVYSGNEQPGRDVFKYSVPLNIEIQNSDKKIRSILKSVKTSQKQYTLSVSTSSITFDSTGGTRTITISSNTDWSISVQTANWGHLSRNGNTLTLKVDSYSGNGERNDFFKIKAGDKEERINIKQRAAVQNAQPSAQIKNISYSQNEDVDGQNGLIIHIDFNVQNMKDKKGRVSVYFKDNDGKALIDLNNNSQYRTTDGKVAVSKDITPGFDNTKYENFTIKIPYSELHQSGTYSRTLKFYVIIWDHSSSPHKNIVSSSYETFTYTPRTETYLKVDNSTYDKVKYFPESGGREIYYISTSESSYETWGVPSWCRIENKTSSSFTLVCKANDSYSERSDYMKVKAGGKEIRIDIKQDGRSSSASVTNCWVTHNLTKPMWNGYMWVDIPYMRIHCHFDVSGHKGENIWVCAFFYYSNGNRVNTQNAEFGSSDGQATVQGSGNCTYENSEWKDYTLDIPYYALPKGSLEFEVEIQDSKGNFLAKSSRVSFSVY